MFGYSDFIDFVKKGLGIPSQQYAEWMDSLRKDLSTMTVGEVRELLHRAHKLAEIYGIKDNHGFRLLTMGNKKLSKELPVTAHHSVLLGLEFTPASWEYTGADNKVYGFEATSNNVCPKAGVCAVMGNCLAFSRPSKTAHIKRSNRKRLLIEHPQHFLSLLFYEIRNAKAIFRSPAFRLNVLSDIIWEHILPDFVLKELSGDFYDYTKVEWRVRFVPAWLNYHLTYSWSERSDDADLPILMQDFGNIAMVFPRERELPFEYRGYPVIDGDVHDYRMGDLKGYIIGLRAKARLRWGVEKNNPMIMK